MSENKIELTGKVKEQIEGLVKQAGEINKTLNIYIQGIIDSKELDGVYQLDLKTFELVKQEKKE